MDPLGLRDVVAITVERADFLESRCDVRNSLLDDFQPFLVLFLLGGPNSVHCEQDTRSDKQYDQYIQHRTTVNGIVCFVYAKLKKGRLIKNRCSLCVRLTDHTVGLLSNKLILFHFIAIFTFQKSKTLFYMNNKDLNRIKVVLVEHKRTNKWLAEQLGKDPATVSKWCTNSSQPSIDMFFRIAELLGVDYTELIVKPKEL